MVLINKNSASELCQKFINGALLVGLLFSHYLFLSEEEGRGNEATDGKKGRKNMQGKYGTTVTRVWDQGADGWDKNIGEKSPCLSSFWRTNFKTGCPNKI